MFSPRNLPSGVQEEPGREIPRYWRLLPEVDWPVADRRIWVVKTVSHRTAASGHGQHKRRCSNERQDGDVATQHKLLRHQFRTGLDLAPVPSSAQSCRWRTDTEVFQTITTDCHLKHPAVHQTTALVVLTMIRFLAYTLSLVFYHRQVRSHARRKCDTFHALAQRFAYWFLAVSPNTS